MILPVFLQIGGGKERMDHYFSSCADGCGGQSVGGPDWGRRRLAAAGARPPRPPPDPPPRSCREPWASITDPAERKAFLKELHELKTGGRGRAGWV